MKPSDLSVDLGFSHLHKEELTTFRGSPLPFTPRACVCVCVHGLISARRRWSFLGACSAGGRRAVYTARQEWRISNDSALSDSLPVVPKAFLAKDLPARHNHSSSSHIILECRMSVGWRRVEVEQEESRPWPALADADLMFSLFFFPYFILHSIHLPEKLPSNLLLLFMRQDWYTIKTIYRHFPMRTTINKSSLFWWLRPWQVFFVTAWRKWKL